ncbi:MAG: repeat-containing protein [Planctomycetota bacterium]|nr:repeat-containing protein [Planctomycetota bacterium]
MPMTFACENCGKRYRVEESAAGKRGKCKECGQTFTIPQPVSPPLPQQAPTPLVEIRPEPLTTSSRKDAKLGTRRRVPRLVPAAGLLIGVGLVIVYFAWSRARVAGDGAHIGRTVAVSARKPVDVPAPGNPVAMPKLEVKPEPVAIGEIRRFEGHTDTVSSVAFSPDGLRAISGGPDKIPRLWEVTTGKASRQFEGDAEGVSGVAFSPDGHSVLSAGGEKTLTLWDAESGRALRRFGGDAGAPIHVAIAPDGKSVASGGLDHAARLWDVATGNLIRPFTGHTERVYGIAFSPDGRSLATGSWDRTVRIWDVATGRELRRFEGHRDRAGDVAFSRDGRRILSGSTDRTMRLWDVDSGKEVARFEVGADAGWAVALSPDGTRALSVHDAKIDLWDVPTAGRIYTFEGHADQVTCLAFSPDGRTALSSSVDRSVRLWGLPPAGFMPPVTTAPDAPKPKLLDPLARGTELRKQLMATGDPVQHKALGGEFNEVIRQAGPDFQELPVTIGGGPIPFTKVILNAKGKAFDGVRFKTPDRARAWDFDWEFAMPPFDGPRGRIIYNWRMVPLDGSEMREFKLMSAHRDEEIEGLDMPRNFHVTQPLHGGHLKPGSEYVIWFWFGDQTPEIPAWIRIRLTPTPDGDVAKTHRDAQVRRLDVTSPFTGLDFTHDGRLALIGVKDEILVWDLETGREVRRLRGNGGGVNGVAGSPEGHLAAVGSVDHKIRLWDPETGLTGLTLEGHAGPVRCVAFSPDGQRLISGSEDRTIRIWDVATGKEIRRFEGHTDQVLCLAFSPGGRRFVSGASITDPIARVWDVETGRVVARLEGNSEAIYAVSVSPDGRSILTGGEDDTIRLYDASTGRQLRKFDAPRGNVNSLAFLADGRRAASAGEDDDIHLWDIATGREILQMEGHNGGIMKLAASRDGRRLLTGSRDLSARLWAIPPVGAR